MFEERIKFEIIFNYTVEQPIWTLDWLSHNPYYISCDVTDVTEERETIISFSIKL